MTQLGFCSSGQVTASTWQAFPSVQGVTVQHESALDIYLFTHTRVTQCFASETRDQQVLPPGVSAMHWPFLFILALRSKSLHYYLTKEWDSIFVSMAVGSCVMCVWAKWPVAPTPKWNRPSFVGDIMTYLKWFLEGLVALTPFPWFVQQSGTFQKQFFSFCWMRIWRWLCP